MKLFFPTRSKILEKKDSMFFLSHFYLQVVILRLSFKLKITKHYTLCRLIRFEEVRYFAHWPRNTRWG